jgi:hypothetical protein
MSDPLEIKKVIEDLILVPTVLRRKKQTKVVKDKQIFISMVRALEKANARNYVMESVGMDLSQYDNLFYDVIDELLILHYGEDAYKLISFYVYDRINPDGSINILNDDLGNELVLKTPEQLWDIISLQPKNAKT